MKTRNFVLTLAVMGSLASGCTFKHEKANVDKCDYTTEAGIRETFIKDAKPYEILENLPVPKELTGENLEIFEDALSRYKALVEDANRRPKDYVDAAGTALRKDKVQRIAQDSVPDMLYKCLEAEVTKYAYKLMKQTKNSDKDEGFSTQEIRDLTNSHFDHFKALWDNMIKQVQGTGMGIVPDVDAALYFTGLQNGFYIGEGLFREDYMKANGITRPDAVMFDPANQTVKVYNTIDELAKDSTLEKPKFHVPKSHSKKIIYTGKGGIIIQ